MGFKGSPAAWFMIPARNLERAAEFYSKVFEIELPILSFGDMHVAPFSMTDKHAGGALIYDPERAGGNGVIVYLNPEGDMNSCLDRVEKANGMITTPRTDIGQGLGYYALFMDSEGNEVGIWSSK